MSDDAEYDSSSSDEDPSLYYQINYLNDAEFSNQDEKDMDEIKKHDIDHLTDKIIQDSHKSELSRQEAFMKVCGKIANLTTPSIEDAIRWFSDGFDSRNLNSKYLTLIQKVNDYYLKNGDPVIVDPILISTDFVDPYFVKHNPVKNVNKNYDVDKDDFESSLFDPLIVDFVDLNIVKNSVGKSFNFVQGSSRFEIGFDFGEPVGLIFVDHLHGEKKHPKFSLKDPWYHKIKNVSMSDYCQIHLINSQQVLLYDSWNIFLVALYYEHEKCKVLSQNFLRITNKFKLLVDTSDSTNFVIFSQGKEFGRALGTEFEGCCIQFGSIVSNRLSVCDQEKLFIANRKVFCQKFSNNTLTVFEPFFGKNTKKWNLLCCELVGNNLEKKFSFNGTQNVELGGFDISTKFTWFKEECFVSIKNTGGKNCLYSFNVLTQNCTMIYGNFPIVSMLNFDFDGHLAAKIDGEISLYFVKNPQKLDRIVWKEIHSQLTVNGKKALYEKAKEELAENSRIKPFSCLIPQIE